MSEREDGQESAMNPRETAQSYDALASHWAGEKVPRTNGIEQHRRAIAFLTDKRGEALDVGCGSSGRLIDLFLDNGFRATGIDVSEKMIELASARGQDAAFHCADITEWEFPTRYDLVSAWDSLWHLGIEAQKAAIRKIAAGLAPGGVFIFTTGGVEEPSEHTDTFLGRKLFYGVLGIPPLLAFLHECGLVLRHFEYDQYPEAHVYLIVQKPAAGGRES